MEEKEEKEEKEEAATSKQQTGFGSEQLTMSSCPRNARHRRDVFDHESDATTLGRALKVLEGGELRLEVRYYRHSLEKERSLARRACRESKGGCAASADEAA